MAEKTRVKPRHLGRGLEALLGQASPSSGQSFPSGNEPITEKSQINKSSVQEIPLNSISENPYQARTYWDEEKLNELARSIEANGVVQPVVVRKTPTGYQLIAGERRFRASKLIGKENLPAVIREASEEQMLEWALVENIHREGLNPVERAKAYQSYIQQFELSQTEAAKRLGEDRSVISNHLRLLELPRDLQQLLQEGQLSLGHIKAIMSVNKKELMGRLANRVLAGRLSVREVERLVKSYNQDSEAKPGKSQAKPPHIIDLEGQLTDRLGCRVRIDTRKKGNKGRMMIEFNSLDEFDSVLEKLGIQTVDEL